MFVKIILIFIIIIIIIYLLLFFYYLIKNIKESYKDISDVIKQNYTENMSVEALQTLDHPILNNFHRSQAFYKNVSLKEPEHPFWVKSWNYVDPDKPHPKWLNYPLVLMGKKFKKNLKTVPSISQFLEKTGPYNVAGLSYLPAKSEISEHRDNYLFSHYVYHLCLTGNDKCHITVNKKKYPSGIPGNVVRFNDSLLHSSNNLGDTPRITLYLSR